MKVETSSASPLEARPLDEAGERDDAGGPTRPLASAPRAAVRVLVGGDVDFGRSRGERLLREPQHDDFAGLRSIFAHADLRFVNLESMMSDRFAASRRAPRPLVFTAPLDAAAVLARAPIDLVSLANNHAWDFGEPALLQTLDALGRVGVAAVGAGRSLGEARAPKVLDASGWRVGFVAVTSAWNQELEPHPGKERIADDDREALVAAITDARRRGAERVIVSHHGGDEYMSEPTSGQRALARAALAAGADVVVGHHAHVVQRVVRIAGKPVLYGLGNLLMRMVTAHPETELGVVARLVFDAGETQVELCPVRAHGLDVVPVAGRGASAALAESFGRSFLEGRARAFADEQALRLGEFDAVGCARLLER